MPSGIKKLLLNLGLNKTYTVKTTEIGAQHVTRDSSTSHREHTDRWTTVHGDKRKSKKSSRYDNDLWKADSESSHRHGQRVNSSDKNRDRTSHPRCFWCGETGHTIKNCFHNSSIHCHRCDRNGHKSKTCHIFP